MITAPVRSLSLVDAIDLAILIEDDEALATWSAHYLPQIIKIKRR